MSKLTFLACLVAICAGCSSVKEGSVVTEWSKSMRELGVYPVFPPREDLYVGDVFVTYEATQLPATADASPYRTLGLHFASIDLGKALKAHYATRPDFPASSATPANGKAVFEPPAQQLRLKSVAFPFFLQATATGAEVGALVPVDALQWKAGLGLNSVKSASVSVSSAESYSLPWILLADALMDANGNLAVSGPGHDPKAEETLGLLRGLAISTGVGQATHIDITVISEVFYARSFDVTLHMNSNAALSLGTNLPGTTEAKGDGASPASPASQASGTSPGGAAVGNSTSVTNAAGLAAAEVEKLRTLQDQAKGHAPTAPGVSVGVTNSSSGDIGLRRTYDKPIAIGYRGVKFRVDLATGKPVRLIPSDVALFTKEQTTERKKNTGN